ncbi:ATP-dependent 6-phosphofructokinase [Oligoflexia bacterium]|nr:ATP-dependent 6-phosphofructokinase [Oligoflexia bacterium]
MAKERIGILTGGGDCPGLNTVIRGVAKSAINQYGLEVIGFHDGFLGLIENRFTILSDSTVSGILTQGGTILGSSNVANPFAHVVEEGDEKRKVDVSDQCVELYHDLGLSALICIGGDGTMSCGAEFADKGMNIIGVPKTIDNDLMGTDYTFGFDSALTTATEAIDKIHTTASSHHRVMFIEIMGRNAGWLTLESAIAGGGDVVLIPEIPYDLDQIVKVVRRRNRFGKKFSIVVVSEGAKPIGGEQTLQRIVEDSPDPIRLGGCSHVIANQIEKKSDIECRVTVLGHLQRGGAPTPRDRMLATRFAVRAVEYFKQGIFNHMVALKGQNLQPVPLTEVMGKQRLVPTNSPLVKVALSVGMSFGVDEKELQKNFE